MASLEPARRDAPDQDADGDPRRRREVTYEDSDFDHPLLHDKAAAVAILDDMLGSVPDDDEPA